MGHAIRQDHLLSATGERWRFAELEQENRQLALQRDPEGGSVFPAGHHPRMEP